MRACARAHAHAYTHQCDSLASSRHPGVCWNKTARKWQARVTHGGKPRYLGYFADEDGASEAYTLLPKP